LALALVPLALITLTSFAKIAVVFSALRNALGAPDVPSASVITALALALTVFVMAPVTESIAGKLVQTQVSSAAIPAVLGAAKEPLATFLAKNAGKAETELFMALAQDRGESVQAGDLRIAWASFAITELKRAFQIGVFVFLPFLVLDFVIANVLLALGLHGLTPSAVALPFKLLLFVTVDGFLLLSRALILGYT
jgi:type III secretion protein R